MVSENEQCHEHQWVPVAAHPFVREAPLLPKGSDAFEACTACNAVRHRWFDRNWNEDVETIYPSAVLKFFSAKTPVDEAIDYFLSREREKPGSGDVRPLIDFLVNRDGNRAVWLIFERMEKSRRDPAEARLFVNLLSRILAGICYRAADLDYSKVAERILQELAGHGLDRGLAYAFVHMIKVLPPQQGIVRPGKPLRLTFDALAPLLALVAPDPRFAQLPPHDRTSLRWAVYETITVFQSPLAKDVLPASDGAVLREQYGAEQLLAEALDRIEKHCRTPNVADLSAMVEEARFIRPLMVNAKDLTMPDRGWQSIASCLNALLPELDPSTAAMDGFKTAFKNLMEICFVQLQLLGFKRGRGRDASGREQTMHTHPETGCCVINTGLSPTFHLLANCRAEDTPAVFDGPADLFQGLSAAGIGLPPD
jgi:hypothetical protein